MNANKKCEITKKKEIVTFKYLVLMIIDKKDRRGCE